MNFTLVVVGGLAGLAVTVVLKRICEHYLSYEGRTTVLALVVQFPLQVFFNILFEGPPILKLAITLTGGAVVFFLIKYLRER